MMQIKTDLNIPDDFRGGVEEGLTQKGYSLVSEEVQKEALKEQANQRKKECYDELCLVDTGKMLAAKSLFLVEITKKSNKLYLFKTKYIDFETGTTQKTKQDYFKSDLTDYEKLSEFGKNIIQNMFGKSENKEDVKELIIKSKSNEKAVKNDEVEIKKPKKNIKMDITEVTVAQFEECVKAGACKTDNFKTNSEEIHYNYGTSNKNHPMNAVNWYGANEYCKWTGKRLPTEEEWIYTARGEENYKYSGSNNADEIAWYKNNSENRTHEVATKKANKYGIYDMSGNVWEWTASKSEDNPKYRLLCGGAYNEYNIQTDFCKRNYPTFILNNYGFRCVKDE